MTCSCLDPQLYLENPLSAVQTKEDSKPVEVDLAEVFDFVDPELTSEVSYEVVAQQPELVDLEVDGDKLKLNLIPDANGITDIEVTAITEAKTTAKDSFSLIIDPIVDPLGVKQEIQDLNFTGETTQLKISLATLVDNPDGRRLKYSATNSNGDLLDIKVRGQQLIINRYPYLKGDSKITVTAETANGKQSVKDTFKVWVDPNECLVLDKKQLTKFDLAEATLFSSNEDNLITRFGKEVNYLLEQGDYDVAVSDEYQVLKTDIDQITGQKIPGVKAVQRFWDSDRSKHFFTNDLEEVKYIEENLPGYVNEGLAFYSLEDTNLGNATINRYLNTETGDHLFTPEAVVPEGFVAEGSFDILAV